MESICRFFWFWRRSRRYFDQNIVITKYIYNFLPFLDSGMKKGADIAMPLFVELKDLYLGKEVKVNGIILCKVICLKVLFFLAY